MKQLSALWWMVRIQMNLVAIIYPLYSIYHLCIYIYRYHVSFTTTIITLEQRIDVDHLAGSLGMLQPSQLVP